MAYPVVPFVDAVIVDVPEPVDEVVRVPSPTVADVSVKVSVSSTLAVTVICPAVDAATVPVSTEVVQASSEKVVIRRKNVLLVALGLTTAPKVTVVVPVGAAELPVFVSRKLPAVEVFTVQPDASPRLVGWLGSVEDATEKPDGVVQAPEAVVQASAENDLRTVAEGATKLNV